MKLSAGVAVVGSINLDIVVHVDRFPEIGETVLGTGFEHVPGGKGANQAIASAQIASTCLIADIGSDDAGQSLTAEVAARHMDVSEVRSNKYPSGRAYISVTPDGENTIVVIGGANNYLEPERVESALGRAGKSVVLTQLEIPLSAVEAAARWCEQNGARFIVNVSPMPSAPISFLASCDPVIVNLGEARLLCDDPIGDINSLAANLGASARSVVVTDGARGAVVFVDHELTTISPVRVAAVDSTGAGDAFAGVIAARLSIGDDLVSAARLANIEAARLVQIPRSNRAAT